MIYGHGDTIHQTEHVDVEVGPDGKVSAVWFRCMMLPFHQADVEAERAESTIVQPATVRLVAVEIETDG